MVSENTGGSLVFADFVLNLLFGVLLSLKSQKYAKEWART